MNVADYLYLLLCLSLYFHIFDFKISADGGGRFSISDILAEFPVEAIYIHQLEWRWIALKVLLVFIPIVLFQLGASDGIVSISGYIGLCILLGPATLASESLRYAPFPKGMTLREKTVAYIDRWFKTRPGEKLNVLVVSGFIAAVIAILKTMFSKLSITGFIARGPWIPELNDRVHPDFLGDTLAALTLFVLIFKGIMAGRVVLKASAKEKTGFLVCSFFAGFNTISFIVSYTALANLSLKHYGMMSLMASVGAIALKH